MFAGSDAAGEHVGGNLQFDRSRPLIRTQCGFILPFLALAFAVNEKNLAQPAMARLNSLRRIYYFRPRPFDILWSV